MPTRPPRLAALVFAAGLVSTAVAIAAAQTPAPPPPAPGCHDLDEMRALEFWVGEWDVYGPDPSAPPSFNRIERLLGGCAVMEHWREAPSGREGKSLFYYRPADRSVRQVWVTGNPHAPGGVKEKRLVERDDNMVRFQGTVSAGGADYLDRTTLTRQPDGAVRQHIEISTDGGSTWRTTFDARYVRRPPAPPAAASVAGEAEACEAAVDAQAAAWGAREPRLPLPGADDPASPRWAQPTDRFGVWIERRFERGRPRLVRIDAAAVNIVRFDDRCAPHVESRPPRPRAAVSGDVLDDAALARILGERRRGVVYVWSPHMPLSVDGIREVREATHGAGVEALVLLDPRADRAYAALTARTAGLSADVLTSFDSVELAYRGLLAHAPATLVFEDGRPAGQAVPGYRDAGGYALLIEQARRGR